MQINAHSLLFSGHMIDSATRSVPRFPPSKEHVAAEKIRQEIEQLKAGTGATLHGFAGGACGGDILFHEACLQLAVSSALYLAKEPAAFVEESVSFAGAGWVARFYALCEKIPVHILPATHAAGKEESSIWARTNEWMMESALKFSGGKCSLLALWDGLGADGPGGTKHMVQEIKKMQQSVVIVDPATLSDPSS